MKLLAVATTFCALVTASKLPTQHSFASETLHANHIFNALHSSMRQWGSSLHHNGMSFFNANVPAGTLFYHGRSDANPVRGTEWVAFEAEMALFFAIPSPSFSTSFRRSNDQHRFGGDTGGYLHTFAAKRDLRLLYVDGQSAAKSPRGTQDTQDYVLVGDSEVTHDLKGESYRANRMCSRARNEWQGKIDGIVRMETGFEVILCSFEESLLPKSVNIITRDNRVDEEVDELEEMVSYYVSTTARYHGIGGHRVTLNYDNFVTAYELPEANLFSSSDTLPRLNGTSKEVLAHIRKEVDLMALTASTSTPHLHDWQSVVDQVVVRYQSRLAYLVSSAMSSHSVLLREIDRHMRPFIDYGDRNYDEEIRRCTVDLLPPHWPLGKAGKAIQSVSNRICSTLAALVRDGKKGDLVESKAQIHALMTWLDWTVWKHCHGCKLGEMCLAPMYPIGSPRDMKEPKCTDKATFFEHVGYWGGGKSLL